jgi:hypothetical protein
MEGKMSEFIMVLAAVLAFAGLNFCIYKMVLQIIVNWHKDLLKASVDIRSELRGLREDLRVAHHGARFSPLEPLK